MPSNTRAARLRELSISLEKLGDVALALGQLDEAQQAFEASIRVATDLVKAYGETASALEVLAEGEMQLSQALEQQGSPSTPDHAARARRLLERLVHAYPHERRYKAALERLS